MRCPRYPNTANLLLSEKQTGNTLSDVPTGRTDGSSSELRPARGWLGRLSTGIAGFSGGMAVNDISGSLGYRGLAGAVALSGVVTAAVWIRGLDPRARLPRYASWVFLAPAGCAAVAATFSSGAVSRILAALAAVLTLGAVLSARELEAAAKLLTGAGLIAAGAGFIGLDSALITERQAPLGAAAILAGAAFVSFGAAVLAGRRMLRLVVSIAFGVATIVFGATFAVDRHVLLGVALIAVGAAVLAVIVSAITGLRAPYGAAGIAIGAGCVVAGGVFILSKPAAIPFGTVLVLGGLALAATAVGVVTGRRALRLAAGIAFGVSLIAGGAVAVIGRQPVLGVALTACGAGSVAADVVHIGPHSFMGWARQLAEWATKVPRS